MRARWKQNPEENPRKQTHGERAARLKAEPQGLVRVSCPQGADRLLTTCLPGFLLRHPKLRVQVVVTNRRVDLIEEGVDVAVRVREKLDTDADLQVKIIGRASSMLVASPAFLDAHGRPADPSEIASYPTLSQTERPGLDRWTLVDDPKTADLTVTLGGLVAFKGWPMTIRTPDGIQVWSDKEKKGLTKSVAASLVKELRERLEGKRK